MERHNNYHSSLNHKLAAQISLFVTLMLTVFTFARFIFDTGQPSRFENYQQIPDNIFEPAISHIIIFFLSCAVIFFLLYETAFWIVRKKMGRLKKYFVAFLGIFGVALLMCFLFFKASLQFLKDIPFDFQNLIEHILYKHVFQIALIISLIVFLSTLYILSFLRNQQTRLENERLISENIRNRHEALKNQLNPHFLFNSLNTLDGLIGFDDEKARSYLHNLSAIFRYTIQNKEITSLREELNFVESYACLMKIRYGNSLQIQYTVDEKYNDFNIMPLSLQLLIENAIKHNVVNDRHPLIIKIITTQNDSIMVSNAIQPKLNACEGEGIGLANLVERYRLLFDLEVMINKTDVFAVEIPLVKKYSKKTDN